MVPWDCVHLSSKPLSEFRFDVGNAGVFEETSEATGFPHSLFSLRVKQFKTRTRRYVLRAGEDLSSLIEENILEKKKMDRILNLCVWWGGKGR